MKLPPALRWLLFAGSVVVCALVLISQPAPRSTLLFGLLVGGVGLIAVFANKPSELDWGGLPDYTAGRIKDTLAQGSHAVLTVLKPKVVFVSKKTSPFLPLAELSLIVLVAWLATNQFADFDPNLKLPGYESEWLTSSAQLAANNLRENGYIPLWQPWLETGEPLIDNPFSFVLNPISTAPSLILGSVNGLKLSVILSTMLAGLGGWFLGRVLGLSSLGRILLGLLLVGKGNMHAMIGAGYFQLGVTQAYFPWIIAGTLAILYHRERRWPIVLAAVMFTLMFWAGNIWYTLPLLISMILLTLAYLFRYAEKTIHWAGLRGIILAGGLIVALSAVTLLPIWFHRDLVGGHSADLHAGKEVGHMRVIEQFYDGDRALYSYGEAPGEPQFYYSFVSPLWFILLIFLLFPWSWPFRDRSLWRVCIVGVLMAVFCTIWGVGGSSLMIWLYRHIKLLGQWRFVGRALAVASFWIAVLIAIRVDALWHYLTTPRRQKQGLHYALAAGLVVASGVAARQVIVQWHTEGLIHKNTNDEQCVTWLREQNPGQELYAYRYGYDAITTFINNKVRIHEIEADFFPIPQPATLATDVDLTLALPEYAVVWDNDQRVWLKSQGYQEVKNSPQPVDEYHCLYQKTDVFSYAFTVPLWFIQKNSEQAAPQESPSESSYSTLFAVTPAMRQSVSKLTPKETTPVTVQNRKPDQITLAIQSQDIPIVVTVQERAYPGWQVEIDGRKAKLESVGGLIGVVLPADRQRHTIHFVYRPPLLLWGSLLTLITSAFCILFLLRADQPVIRWTARRRSGRNIHPKNTI